MLLNRVKVDMHFGSHNQCSTVVERQIIRTLDDVDVYVKQLSNEVNRAMTTFVTSNVPVDKLDHVIPSISAKRGETAIMRLSVAKGDMHQTNPIYELEPAAQAKLRQITDDVIDGHVVLLNDVGGYHYLGSDPILEEWEDDGERASTVNIVLKDSKYIVLENDMELPEESEKFLKANDPNFSTIYDLRAHCKNLVLANQLSAFKSAGGSHVYVYTTGMDVPQMYIYAASSLAAGLKNLHVHLVGAPESGSELEQFCEWASTMHDGFDKLNFKVTYGAVDTQDVLS